MVHAIAPALLFIACVLTGAACTDRPPPEHLHEGAAALTQPPDGGGSTPTQDDPVCPELGASPSPLPADLPLSPTASAGTIEGFFSVSSSGEGLYTIPLNVPPGRAGVQPTLALSYSSAAGEGLFGMGFALTGLSSVTRCPENLSDDGTIREVMDRQDDPLCLDGKRLIPVPLSDKNYSWEARTFPDTFTKVLVDCGPEKWNCSRGPQSIRTYTKSGLILDYGTTPSGQVFAKDGIIRAWWVTRVSDRHGNTIDYAYHNDRDPTDGHTIEHAPKRIDYTGHLGSPALAPSRAVAFEVDTKPAGPARTLFARGMALRSSWRITRVTMLGPGDALVREYQLHYHHGPATGRTLLDSITECAADHVCKPPTRFTWHHGGAPGFADLPTPIQTPHADAATLTMMDVTGDGLDDLVIPDVNQVLSDNNVAWTDWTVATNRAGATSVFFNTSEVASEESIEPPPSPAAPDAGTPIDYNQDGLMDVFLHDAFQQFPNWKVLVATPSHKFKALDTGVPRFGPVGDAATAHLADVNGDGVADLIQCTSNGPAFRWALHLWTPDKPGFASTGIPIDRILEGYPCSTMVHTVDVNNDGKVDLLVPEELYEENGTAVFGTNYLALSYQPSNVWRTMQTRLPIQAPAGVEIFLDVNGDGLPDAIESGFQDRQLRTFINTGDGFAPARNSLPSPVLDADAFVRVAAPIDHNGDGRQDLLIPMRLTSNLPSWVVLQATGTTGDGTFTIVDSHLPLDVQITEDGVTLASKRAPRVTDVDGDGAQDVLLGTGGYIHAFKNGISDEDLLETVSDGLNDLDPGVPGYLPNVQVAYGHLVDVDASSGHSVPAEETTYLPRYEPLGPACAYPVQCAVGPRRVVSGYVLNNGADRQRRFAVSYRNGRYDRLGRGFLGFGERLVRDLDTGATTADFYDNTTYDGDLKVYPHAGQAVRAWRWSPDRSSDAHDGVVELSYANTMFQTVKTSGGKTYFTLPVLHREVRAQGVYPADGRESLEAYVGRAYLDPSLVFSESIRAVANYDAYGNALDEVTSTTGVDVSLDVKRTFQNDEGAWLIGLPTSVTECSKAAGIEQCRTTTRRYNPLGRLESESVSADDGDPETQVTVSYAYDDFGNIRKTAADDGFGDHRASCTSYDGEGIFPYAQVNAAYHLSYMKFDPGLGVQTALVDPNGLVTQWAHDGLGRTTREQRPDGTATTITFSRTGGGGPPLGPWRVQRTTQTDGRGETTVEYDSLGRPIRSWWPGVQTGAQPVDRVMQEIAFDDLGEHVARRSVPAGENTLPADMRHDQFEFDAVGRVVKHTSPWNSVTTYRYRASEVRISSPGSATTVIENDALGRPVSITDAEQGVTQYTYGPFGGLWTVSDPGKAVTTTERDALGRVRREVDPDRGTTIAHYNGFGERTWSTDQAGRQITYIRDVLGRVVQREDADGTTRWTWDQGNKAVGKLVRVESPTGNVEETSYDDFGRVKTTTLEIDQERFGFTLDYDSHGLIQRVTYPAGDGVAPFVVRQGYDPSGHLISVQDDATAAVYWRFAAADGAGRIQTERFGDGSSTTRTYDEAKSRVKTIVTTQGAETLQDLRYDYDDRLNLSYRHDGVQQATENFAYDRLDRLKCAYFDPMTQWSCWEIYTYAPDGNLQSKPGVGAYTYDPNHPHAVATAGDDHFRYDAVGNQTSRPGATATYTAFDLPKTWTLDGALGTIALDYDGDQQRVRKTTPDGETIYAGDLYERVSHKGGGVEHRYLVRSSERVVAIVSRQAAKGLTPATSRTTYVHVDNLGSVDVLRDDSGHVERQSYDAFGARRDPRWEASSAGPFPWGTDQGYTGHVADPELGLVHMKGRVYDPKVGRFLTPDPVVPTPHFGQSWNPYTYVLNNPLAYVDPSGFDESDDELQQWKSDPRVSGQPYVTITIVDKAPNTPPPVAPPPKDPNEEKTESRTTDGTEVGALLKPIDVNVYGNAAGYTPEPAATKADQSPVRGIEEIAIGVGIGLRDAAEGIARFAVLNALTLGGYGTYGFGRALWYGYKDGGVLGALNAVNPIYQVSTAGVDTYLAAERGDYRAAGAAGTSTVLLGAATVLGAGELGEALDVEFEAAAARGAPELLPQHAGPVGEISPGEVMGKTPAEIHQRAVELGLQPRGPAPMEGRGSYIDPQTKVPRIMTHTNDAVPHGHVNNPAGQRIGPGGQVVPPKSPEAHLPIKVPE